MAKKKYRKMSNTPKKPVSGQAASDSGSNKASGKGSSRASDKNSNRDSNKPSQDGKASSKQGTDRENRISKATAKRVEAEKRQAAARRQNQKSKKTTVDKGKKNKNEKLRARSRAQEKALQSEGYLVNMSHAPRIDEGIVGFQMIPAALFTAVVILIVRQYTYFRDMSQYYWSAETGQDPLVEFFSHYKVVLIEFATVLAILVLLYRVITQQFAVKRSNLYIPMGIYVVFTFASFLFSSDREVAWNGWNDRFEGTVAILCYMLLLFYIINTVNSERNIKWIVYPLAGTTVLLSALGISQATGNDFFQTTFGQKLIVPNVKYNDGMYAWEKIDQAAAQGDKFLKFTFQNNEIYQTVYNINYVSFYLTLLLPIFGMLLIYEKKLIKKILWGVLFALVMFNLFGSASSGGYLGVFFVLVLAVIVLRKKIIKWWKPVVCILAITVITGAASIGVVSKFGGVYWYEELLHATFQSVGSEYNMSQNKIDELPSTTGDNVIDEEAAADPEEPVPTQPGDSGSRIDYFITEGNTLTLSLDKINTLKMSMSPVGELKFTDGAGNELQSKQDPETNFINIDDERYGVIDIVPTKDEEENEFVVLQLRGEDQRWPFMLMGEEKDQLAYRNDLGKPVNLVNVPHIGFQNNLGFGSGRGYIWSRSFPMFKNTILVGHGPDTYCIYFPHKDYIGKYNAGWNINMIVDKPHNMFIHSIIGNGMIATLGLIVLFVMYLIQSIKLYWREEYDSYAAFVGAGILFGITGFLVSGIVDDSSVSTMPMFYGLLGTGIAINIMIKHRRVKED